MKSKSDRFSHMQALGALIPYCVDRSKELEAKSKRSEIETCRRLKGMGWNREKEAKEAKREVKKSTE